MWRQQLVVEAEAGDRSHFLIRSELAAVIRKLSNAVSRPQVFERTVVGACIDPRDVASVGITALPGPPGKFEAAAYVAAPFSIYNKRTLGQQVRNTCREHVVSIKTGRVGLYVRHYWRLNVLLEFFSGSGSFGRRGDDERLAHSGFCDAFDEVTIDSRPDAECKDV